MNNVSVNLHGYFSKFVNLHNYTLTDVSPFQEKLRKFYTFFLLYTPIDVSALRMCRPSSRDGYVGDNSFFQSVSIFNRARTQEKLENVLQHNKKIF